MSIPAWVTNFLGAASAAATTYSAIKTAESKPSAPPMPKPKEQKVTPQEEAARAAQAEQKIVAAGEMAAEVARRKAARKRGYMSTLLTPLGQSAITTGVRKSLLGG